MPVDLSSVQVFVALTQLYSLAPSMVNQPTNEA